MAQQKNGNKSADQKPAETPPVTPKPSMFKDATTLAPVTRSKPSAGGEAVEEFMKDSRERVSVSYLTVKGKETRDTNVIYNNLSHACRIYAKSRKPGESIPKVQKGRALGTNLPEVQLYKSVIPKDESK